MQRATAGFSQEGALGSSGAGGAKIESVARRIVSLGGWTGSEEDCLVGNRGNSDMAFSPARQGWVQFWALCFRLCALRG
uniref:Uncharacterized protein n=1 Tax=mine drainage metagenome TaxID=410659 RepID=E6QIX3_9ZZZZ